MTTALYHRPRCQHVHMPPPLSGTPMTTVTPDPFASAAAPVPSKSAFLHTPSHHHVHSSAPPHAHHHHHAHDHPAIAAASATIPTASTTTPTSSTWTWPRRSFWNTRCCCLFSHLPDEILLFNVFSFLNVPELCVLQGVCQRWRFLSCDRVLWPKLDLSAYTSLTDDTVSHLLNRFGSHLSILKLCNLTKLTSRSLLLSSSQDAHVTATATGSTSPFMVTPPPRSLTLLRELHLCNVRAVDDTVILGVAAHCLNLEHISLFGCLQVTDRSLVPLLTNCRKLEELSLRGLVHVTSAALAYLPPRLKGLNIASCRSINADGIRMVARMCPQLLRLNAHGVQVNDVAIEELTRGCPELNTLHISSANPFGGNAAVTDMSIAYMARLANLTCLNVQGSSNVTDASLSTLLSSCRQLTRLNLGGCYRITDQGVYAIAEHAFALTHLSLFQCFHVTDQSIAHLLRRAALLEHLDLHSCVALTSAMLDVLVMTTNRSVSGTGSASVSPSSVSRSHSPLLQDVAGGDAALSLDLSPRRTGTAASSANEDVAMSDAGLALVHDMQRLDLNDSFVVANLRTLDLGSCKNIRAEHVAALRAMRPSLKITHY